MSQKYKFIACFRKDLDTNDVMLLDAGDEIYMWVGAGATAEENGRILDLAKVCCILKAFKTI